MNKVKDTALLDPLIDFYFGKSISFLEKMVRIGSHSFDKAGIERMVKAVGSEFSKLDFARERAPSGDEDFADHLFLNKKGTGKKNLWLVGHLDTVFTREEESRHDFKWKVIGDRISGPGTCDMKGGIAMAWLVVKVLGKFCPELLKKVNITLALNSCEEQLNDSFAREVLKRVNQDTLAALIFEYGPVAKDSFGLLNHRKGLAAYHVDVQGRGAHTGNHADGANAIVQLAKLVDKIAKWTDYDRGLTVNIGTIKGGSARNRVPQQAEAEIEVRAARQEDFESIETKFADLTGEGEVRSAADGFACKISCSLKNSIPPWEPDEKTFRLQEHWARAAAAMNMHLMDYSRGGLGDANHLGGHLPTLDALGPDGANLHCSETNPAENKEAEYMNINTFSTKTKLNCLGILDLLNNSPL